MASKRMVVFMGHSIHADWQARKGCDYQYKTVKRHARLYGEFRREPDGRTTYWALRAGEHERVVKYQGWAIDTLTFAMIKTPTMAGKVDRIGIEIPSGDHYLISVEDFDLHKKKWDFDGKVGVAPWAKGKLGADQWLVKIDKFKSHVGVKPSDLAEEIFIRRKWG